MFILRQSLARVAGSYVIINLHWWRQVIYSMTGNVSIWSAFLMCLHGLGAAVSRLVKNLARKYNDLDVIVIGNSFHLLWWMEARCLYGKMWLHKALDCSLADTKVQLKVLMMMMIMMTNLLYLRITRIRLFAV